jgi:tRNA nucleotidyltransferase (CCA-adding enzyme)
MISLDQLPNAQRRAIDVVREVAADKGCRPFLVGGPIRDLLLGRSVADIDLTLEDGSSTLARALAKRLSGRIRSFPQFLTYKVTAEDFPEIDIATARKEKYSRPGALPAVTAGRLNDDLLRRDFSMNAIAFDLTANKLHDPSGGTRDIQSHVVRVLHDNSFVDDPTRIFRALRFAARLQFTIDPHTRVLLDTAIEAGALRMVSRERLWRELFLAFDEADAPAVITALSDEGAIGSLFGAPAPHLRHRLNQVREAVARDAELDREVLYIAALLYGNASPVDLEGSGLSQKRARNVMQIANELPRTIDALAEATSEQQRFRLLRHASPELLSIIEATTPDERPHVARFHDYQKFRLPLRGTDLEVPSGPHIARALERTREAVFTGEISVDEAKGYAREVAMKYLGGPERSEGPPSE